jgi:hypothetical protein
MGVDALEAAIGLLLLLVLPGFGIYRAVLPERRILRPWSASALIEAAAASLLLSLSLTVIVGWLWLGSSAGFSAAWTDPTLEASLASIAAVAFVVAALRGGFARTAPAAPALDPEGGTEGPMEIVRELERLTREERRIAHRLRRVERSSGEATALQAELDRVRGQVDAVRARREAEYAL